MERKPREIPFSSLGINADLIPEDSSDRIDGNRIDFLMRKPNDKYLCQNDESLMHEANEGIVRLMDSTYDFGNHEMYSSPKFPRKSGE